MLKNKKKKRSNKNALNISTSNKLKIDAFLVPQNLLNRAETAARAQFPHMHLITKKCTKCVKKTPVLDLMGTQKSLKMRKK